jgi:uncharacterized protein (TIGR02266 family)
MMEPMAEDTKKDQRVKAPVLRAKYKSRTLDEFIEKYSRDISRSGMWIKSAKPPALGTLLKVEILLEDASPVISAVGRVVKRREEGEASAENPAGMGIRFLKIDEVSQPVIERIVALKGEDAGPHFENIRTGATVPPPSNTGESHSAFFGSTNPSKEMPADADRTMMRQMNALLGEALRQVNEAAPRKDAAPMPTQKATIMGVAAPAGMLEQALAVAREVEGRKADEGPTKVATRSEIDNALEKLKTLEDPDAKKPEAPKVEAPKVEAPKVEAPKVEAKPSPAKSAAMPPRSLTTKTASVPPPPSTRPIDAETPHIEPAKVEGPAKAVEPVAAAEPAKVVEPVAAAEPAKVDEPVAVAEPAKVDEPVAVAEPAKADEPVAVAEPAKADEPVAAAEPAKVDESVAAAEPAKVDEPVAAAEPAKVDEPIAAAEPAKVEEAVAAAEPAKVEEAVAAAEPAKVEEAVAAAEPAKVDEPVAAAEPVKADEPVAAAEPAKVAVPVVTAKDEAKPTPKKADAKPSTHPVEAQGNPMSMVITVAVIAVLAFAVYWFLLRGNEAPQHPGLDVPGAVSALLAKSPARG